VQIFTSRFRGNAYLPVHREAAETAHLVVAGGGDAGQQRPCDGTHEQPVGEHHDQPGSLRAEPVQELGGAAEQAGEGLGSEAGVIGVGPVPVRPGVWLAFPSGAGAPVQAAEVGEFLDGPFLARGLGEPADRRLRSLAGPPRSRASVALSCRRPLLPGRALCI